MKKRLICFGVALALVTLMSSGTVLTQGKPDGFTEICVVLNGTGYDLTVPDIVATILCGHGLAVHGTCDSGGL